MPKNSEIQHLNELPQTGLLRIKQVLKFVPVSRSNWWAGVKSGRFPKPMKLSERVTVWKASDIRDLVEGTKPDSASSGEWIRIGGGHEKR
jgi:predicted DNA-binding transcriptional regulator AlpA